MKKLIALVMLLVAIYIATGFYETGKLVEEVYTVKSGDTFWSISEDYLKKNTGKRMYIMELQQNIRDLNPELQENHCQVRPGQKIRIKYWRETCSTEKP